MYTATSKTQRMLQVVVSWYISEADMAVLRQLPVVASLAGPWFLETLDRFVGACFNLKLSAPMMFLEQSANLVEEPS
jgi:hypothetical protein